MQNNWRSRGDRRLTIGLYTPSLQGLYVGEIVNQIRQLCFIKGYQLVVVRTGGLGSFDSDLHRQRLDGAVIIRNAVSPVLVEKLLASGVACVAIAYDYFPHKLPLVTLDNEHGMNLAIDQLLAQGRRRIAFVGDLSQYDLRKRYETYCTLCEDYGLHQGEPYVFPVRDTLFSGGQVAAQQFIERRCDADAVIFGASFTGIGFIQHVNQTAKVRGAELTYACFDANPLNAVFAPEMLVIDQNLAIMAYRSLNVLESQIDGQVVPAATLVEPTLMAPVAAHAEQANEVTATCADGSALRSPHYLKALLANCHEWPAQIGGSDLDRLMILAPVFPGLLQSAFLLRHFTDGRGDHWVKHTKTFTLTANRTMAADDRASFALAGEGLPATVHEETPAAHDFCLNLPIHVDDELWGWLVVLGKAPEAGTPSSYFAFAGFMESSVRLYEQGLSLSKRVPVAAPTLEVDQTGPPVDPAATIHWTVATGLTLWSERALAALGFVSPIECHIYQNMEITDRVHRGDLEGVREAVAECCTTGKEVRVVSRVKCKGGSFARVALRGRAIMDGSKTSAIEFCLGLQPNTEL